MQTSDPRRADVRAFAKTFADRGEYGEWFQALYEQSGGSYAGIPWASLEPNPSLTDWLDRNDFAWGGRRAVVVGCGLGDDAEELARRGFLVTAFDLAPGAIAGCRARFPGTPADYLVADLFDPPAALACGFDFVLESYTVQALPVALRERAVEAVARLVAPGGWLLVICRGRDDADPPGEMPWPLTRAELESFGGHGLKLMTFEDYMDQAEPDVRRFRALFARASGCRH